MISPLLWKWHPRPSPLSSAAVAAQGGAANALRERLLARNDESPVRLSGVCGDGLILLVGDESDLPWVDGAVYLGRDPLAPGVLLSTILAPSVPLPLLVRALQAQFPDVGAPFAILSGEAGPTVVPLALARPVAREVLTRCLGNPG